MIYRTRSGVLGPGGLIFGLIRLRSSAFSRVRFNAAMQVTDVNGIRRTIIQTSENRKVDSSLTTKNLIRTKSAHSVVSLQLRHW
jgi:hypothetical protein